MQNMLGFNNAMQFKQTIFCFINHGVNRVIYRSFPHILSGENLATHCFLLSLERWIKNNGDKCPDTIYYSFDGGPENGTKAFIALCHLIVHKKLCRHMQVFYFFVNIYIRFIFNLISIFCSLRGRNQVIRTMIQMGYSVTYSPTRER